MECMETRRKQNQNITGEKEFHDHGTWKGHNVRYSYTDYVTNTQSDTIVYSKTQTDFQED